MSNFRKEFLTRQSTLIEESLLSKKVTVIGAGAIGSHTVMMLARMGISSIEVWDYDLVSEENMNNQGYNISDIDEPKVECLARKVRHAMGFNILPRYERYTGGPLKGIVIAAVDSMAVRQLISENLDLAEYIIDPLGS